MARRGRFGRTRRTTSNLTSLVAQLIREQRAAEDRAIFDAYKNGGLYKGARVDDNAIIAYITSRRDSISQDDPLYDQWNNTLIQTKFSIGEQKIGLAFKEGRASAGDVAAFYRDQLKSLTPDSDFYRDVAGRAAEWAKSAAAAGRAAASARLRKQLEAAEKSAAGVIEGFKGIDAALERAAREAGIIAGNQSLTDANASALFALMDRGVMGADGTPITYSEWQDAAVASWKAQGTVIDLRKQGDFAYTELQNQRDKFMSGYLVQLNAADDRQKYEAARETWLTAIDNAQGDPQAMIDANAKYAKVLTTIRDEAVKGQQQNDPDFIGGLASEIAAVTGNEPTGPTVSDLYGSSFGGEPGGAGGFATGNDAQDTFEATVRAVADADALATGTAYLGQTEPGSPLSVIPFPTGGANDPFGRGGLDQSVQPSIENINGKQRLVYLQGTPIRAAAYVDDNGNPVAQPSQQDVLNGNVSLNTKDAPVLGYSFMGPTGTLSYGILQPDGRMLFTKENPFSGGAVSADGQTFLIADSVENGIPNTQGLLKPLSLNPTTGEVGATLLPTGTTVSTADMLRLVDTGALANVTPEDRQAIANRAMTDAQNIHGERATQPDYRGQGASLADGRRAGGSGFGPGLLDILDTVRDGVGQTFGGNKVDTVVGAPPTFDAGAGKRATAAPTSLVAPSAPIETPYAPRDLASPGGANIVLKDLVPTYDPKTSTPSGSSRGSAGGSVYAAVQGELRRRQAKNPYEQRAR
ncbi:MAG: hypothetical protein EPN91_03360 [Salinibacterium sp.]|nr:MAG: hypothetical protein EPN91_03360 [Salinibacterium sp.]